MQDIEQKLKDIVVEQLGIREDQITSEAKFIEDLGADSLDCVELVMAAEDEFGIDITDEESEKITTFGEAVALVKKASGEEAE